MRACTLVAAISAITLATQLGAAQESAAPFDAPVVVLPVDSAPFQKLFDFDGDGDLDAVGHKMTEDPIDEITVQVWRNDGSGRFVPHWIEVADPPYLLETWNPMRVATGDFGGDGLEDFALGGGSAIWRYDALAAGGFAKTAYATGGDVFDLVAADFDGDGGSDLAALYATRIIAFWSDGTSTSLAVAAGYAGIDRLLVTETDGDALPDLAGVNVEYGVVLYAFEGHVLAQSASFATVEGGHLSDSADVDSDGDEDLVRFGTSPFEYEVLRRTGSASWTLEPSVLGGPAEYLVNIDGDGDPDGVCCGGGGGGGGPGAYPELDFVSKFEIAMNLGGGAFAPAFEMEGLGSKSLAGAADVDGDGDVNLLAGRCVYYARGGPPSPAPLAKLDVSPSLAFADQFTDWDLDGDLDITLYVGADPWLNFGDGSFGPWPNWPWNVNPPGTVTSAPRIFGDFDGDGDADVVMPLYQPQPFAAALFLYMYLWRNQAGAGLVPFGPAGPPGVNFIVGPYAYSPETALVHDLDGDGDVDVAMRTYGPSMGKSTWLYWNDGTGYFTSGGQWPSERIEAVADLDRDGWPDAIVSTGLYYQQTTLKARHGTGSGSGAAFAPARDVFPAIFVQDHSFSIEVCDLNADGFQDVAAVRVNLGVQVFVNPLPFGSGPTWIAAAPVDDVLDGSSGRVHGRDVNGDGLNDLVVGFSDSAPNARTVHVLKASAAGAVLAAGSYEPPAVQILNGLYPGDFDGDGDVDFAGKVIHRNATFHGDGAGFRQQYGANNAGSGGFAPILGAQGPFRVGETIQIRLRGASPSSLTFLDVAPSKAAYAGFPTPQTTCWIDVFSPALAKFPLPSGGQPGTPGTGGYSIPVSVNAGMVGPQFELQVFVIDFGAAGYVTASNGLSLRFGP